MPSTRAVGVCAASLLAVFALAGCQSGPETTAQAPAEATPSARAAAPDGTTSPISRRDKARQKAWAEAIDGLRFDRGLVEVVQPPATPDTELAARMMTEGDTALNMNHRTPAVKAYAAAIRAAPDMTEPYFRLARALVTKGKTDLAIASYRTIIAKAPDNVEGYVGLAKMLAMQQRYDEAVAEMETATRLDPGHGRAHERLAIWEYYRGNDEAAWDHVRSARAAGQPLPPQFINLLTARTPE